MKNVEIKSNDQVFKFTLPTSWDEVSVGDFMDIVKVNDNELLSDFTRDIQVIHIVSGISEEIINDMDYDSEYVPMLNELSFLKDEVPERSIEYVTINNDEYYLKKDFDNKTTGEVASFDLIFKKHENNLYTCMDQLLPLFLRKKDKEGKLERFNSDMMDRVSMFRDKVNVADVLSLFFYSSGGSKVSTPK